MFQGQNLYQQPLSVSDLLHQHSVSAIAANQTQSVLIPSVLLIAKAKLMFVHSFLHLSKNKLPI